MKKLKSMLVTLAMLLCTISASAEDFSVDGIYYKITDSEKLTVEVTYRGRYFDSYGNEYTGSVVIPETVTYESKTYSVTSIGNSAFYECTSLTSVTIPNSITSIGSSAFSYCSSLTSITIPNSVTSIGGYAFHDCTSLTSITIPNSVTSIGDHAFYGCNLKTMIIGLGVTSIGSYQSTPVKTIWLTNTPPEGYLSLAGTINYVATENYSSLSNKTIYPYLKSMFVVDGVTYVPVDMTKKTCDVIDCSYEESEKNINIGKSVTYKNISMAVEKVKPYAFYGYDYIKTLILDYVGEIETYSFSGCTNLNTVTLGNYINSIGDYVFSDCTNLNTVTLGDGINSIGDYAFSGCTNLNELTIGSGLQTIGASAFKGCTAITEIDTKVATPPSCGTLALEDIDKWACTLTVPKGCLAAYQTAEQWSNFFFINEENEIPDVPVDENCEINITNNMATFCCAYDLDFTNVEGLKAYIASGFNKATNTVLMTRVYDVPAGTGLVLIGEAGDYQVKYSTSTSCYTNLLKGVLTETTIGTTSGENTNYVLANGSHGTGFYPLSQSGTLAAGKAYLQLPTFVSSAKGFSMSFEDETTGISDNYDVEIMNSDAVVYDMQGRKVKNPTKGLYIVNGKKVVIK